MSLVVEALASSCNTMGLNGEKGSEVLEKTGTHPLESDDEVVQTQDRQASESPLYTTEEEDDDDDDDDDGHSSKLQLGPQCTLKEHLEKDKDDESLRKWKEELLGCVDLEKIGENLEADVKIFSLSIVSPGRSDIVLAIPESGNPEGLWFTLKEGSRYNLKFSFQVNNNIVSGLSYTNTVWKTGVKVDSTRQMLGTFSPHPEAYTHQMPEETTPSGFFFKGNL